MEYVCLISLVESKNAKKALMDEFWVKVLQRELVENKIITFENIETEKQLANIFTKAQYSVRFDFLRKALRIYLV